MHPLNIPLKGENNMLQKLQYTIVTTIMLLLLFTCDAFAADPVVRFNGSPLDSSYISNIDGCIFISCGQISKYFGYMVSCKEVAPDYDSEQVTITNAGTTVTMTTDNHSETITKGNDTTTKYIDTPPFDSDAGPFISVKYLAEDFGLTLTWDGNSKTIDIVGEPGKARTAANSSVTTDNNGKILCTSDIILANSACSRFDPYAGDEMPISDAKALLTYCQNTEDKAKNNILRKMFQISKSFINDYINGKINMRIMSDFMILTTDNLSKNGDMTNLNTELTGDYKDIKQRIALADEADMKANNVMPKVNYTNSGKNNTRTQDDPHAIFMELLEVISAKSSSDVYILTPVLKGSDPNTPIIRAKIDAMVSLINASDILSIRLASANIKNPAQRLAIITFTNDVLNEDKDRRILYTSLGCGNEAVLSKFKIVENDFTQLREDLNNLIFLYNQS